jgi:lysophospholipase L1-like esterase
MRFIWLAAVGALVVVAAAVHGATGAAGNARSPEYLALGDSLAVSMQPDAHGHDHAGSHGYAEAIWRSLAMSTHGLKLVKLGRGGATAASMSESSGSNPSQLEQAERQLRSRKVTLVTIDIGANEVEQCQHGAGFDSACVRRNLAALRANLPKILAGLRAAGGPTVPIVGINYYNSYLGRWVSGSTGRQIARASVPVERSINAALAQLYKRAGVAVADVQSRFASFTFRTVDTRAYGRVPLAVARICRWTWACSASNDDHANTAGYQVIARTVLAVLHK